MGDKWREGIYDSEKLTEALHLLPWTSSDETRPKCPTSPSSSTNYNQSMSIISSDKQTALGSAEDHVTKSIKERHISIDSAKDSGIGENSNFTDIDTSKFDEESKQTESGESESISPENGNRISTETETDTETLLNADSSEADMRGLWQPKQKRSITERLPEKSFYLIQPSRYIFPGAELYIDPDEKVNYFDSTTDSSDSDESETETENVDSSF